MNFHDLSFHCTKENNIDQKQGGICKVITAKWPKLKQLNQAGSMISEQVEKYRESGYLFGYSANMTGRWVEASLVTTPNMNFCNLNWSTIKCM